MERDVGFLRCSKLSCYSEFNRMVQAIARNGSGFSQLQGSKGMTGTSAEYQFYYSLAMMLRQIVSNIDPIAQKQELQHVYDWYCLNKPLIQSKTKRSQRKPVLTFTIPNTTAKKRAESFERPQTAPANLFNGGEHNAFLCLEGSSGKFSRSTSANKERAMGAFTSSYISRSLSRELDCVGRPFDQLQSVHAQDKNRPKTTKESKTSSGQLDVKVSGPQQSSLSVIEFPSRNFPSGNFPTPRHRPATVGAVSCEQLFKLSSSVAAKMYIDKEMRVMHKEYIQRSVSAQSGVRTSPRQLINSPVEHSRPSKEKGLLQTKQRDDKTRATLQIEDPQGHRTQSKTNEHEPSTNVDSQGPDSDDNFLLKGRAMHTQTQRYGHTNTAQHSSMAVITEVLDEDATSTRSNSPTKVTSRPESKIENPPKTEGEKNLLSTSRVDEQTVFQQPEPAKLTGKGDALSLNSSRHNTPMDVNENHKELQAQVAKDSQKDSESATTISQHSVSPKHSDNNDKSDSSMIEFPVSPTVTVKTHIHRTEHQKVISESARKKRLTAPVKVTTFTFIEQDDKTYARSHDRSSNKYKKALRLSRPNRNRSLRPKTVQSQSEYM